MHLSGMIIFFREGASQGCSAPSINLGPLISRFLFVKLFLCFSFLGFFATFVKVMGQGQTRSKITAIMPQRFAVLSSY